MKNIYNEPKLLKNIGLTKKRITFLLVLCYGPSQVRVQISFPRPTVARPPPTVPWGRYSVNNCRLSPPKFAVIMQLHVKQS